MEYQSIAIIWVGLSLLVAGIAWLKNRSVATWLISALIFSPLITFLIIIFMSGVEKYEYTGEATLNNEAYKIYLTKQYHIEKLETIGKFQSQDKTFEKVFDALRYAQSIDRGIALEYLDEIDPISSSGIAKSEIENISAEKPISDKIVDTKIQNNGVVSKSSGGSGILIGGIAVLCLAGLFYFAYQNETPSTSSLQSLDTREDVSKYTIDGELAKAFNLNSKYTDVQRENLLKQIKGQLVIWEVEIYEIDKKSDKVYRIQTSGGLNIGTSDVGTFIELTAKDTLQSNFIEGLKTGQVIRIKGILTGESNLRSLIIKPAILWYPESRIKPDESNKKLVTTPTSKTIPQTFFDLSKIEEKSSIPPDLEARVFRAFEGIYGVPLRKNDCQFMRLESESIEYYCIELHDAQAIDGKVYATVIGAKRNKDKTPADSHIDQGIIKFIIFSEEDGKLRGLAESPFIDAGTFGAPNTSIKLVALNEKGKYGWITHDGDMHQGEYHGNATLYTEVNEKIKDILTINTNYGNLSDSNSSSATVALRIIRDYSQEIFPIEAKVEKIDGASKKINSTHIIKFNYPTNNYIIPDSFKKAFD